MLAVVLVGVLWGAGTAYASTWSYTVDVTRTTAGIKDFTYRHQILWSGNGSTISSYQASDWSQYTAVGWPLPTLPTRARSPIPATESNIKGRLRTQNTSLASARYASTTIRGLRRPLVQAASIGSTALVFSAMSRWVPEAELSESVAIVGLYGAPSVPRIEVAG